MNSERRNGGGSILRIWSATLLAVIACADLERGPAPTAPVASDAAAFGADAVGEAGASGALSYSRDVHTLIVDACARCHSEGGQAGRTALVLARAAAADFVTVSKFINRDVPVDSRLLVKGLGMGHEGGAALMAGSPEQQTILQWITQGGLP